MVPQSQQKVKYKNRKVFNTDIFSIASYNQEMRKSLLQRKLTKTWNLSHNKDSKVIVVNKTLWFKCLFQCDLF